MQLALTPEVLVPVGAGAALLLVVLIVVFAVRRRRAPDRATVADAVREAEAPPVDADPVRTAEVGPDSESGPAERVGSGRTVAAAVAQALAVREARARVAGPPVDAVRQAPEDDEPADVVWQEPAPQGRGDARDRLLAVLLDDPVRAVGATMELEACRRQLDRLTDAVQHERHVLGAVLARLAEAGLAPDQLARLSGLSDEELRDLLPERANA